MAQPRYDAEHSTKGRSLIEAVQKTLDPQQSAYVYLDATGDVFWGGNFGGTAQNRKDLLRWLNVIRKDIMAYQKKHDT